MDRFGVLARGSMSIDIPEEIKLLNKEHRDEVAKLLKSKAILE